MADRAGAAVRGGRGMPLGFVVGRYFLYVLASLALWAFAVLAAANIVFNMGIAYPANYGALHLGETADALAAQDAFDPAAIPSAYRYAHLAADGGVLATDMGDRLLAEARGTVAQAATGGGATNASGRIQVVLPLADGTWCALSYELLPQFTSRALRDGLPNPQNLLLVAFVLGGALILAAFAARAARVLTRKMAPLADAAEHVGRQDLDFEVGTSNVRQIEDVLAAMERMRASLKESLEARWRAEAAQRAQMAALAHDLKTPLTIVCANADYLAEDDRLTGDAREAAQAAAQGARRLDGYVRLIVAASRDECARAGRDAVPAADLADALERQARELAAAEGRAAAVARTDAFRAAAAAGRALMADGEAIERAAMNLVGNALDHTQAGGTVYVTFDCPTDGDAKGQLAIGVEDDGPGFSPEALVHGCERFFRDDAARTGTTGKEPAGAGDRADTAGHFGLGLAIALDIAQAHGGTVELSNRIGPDGHVCGARARLVLPLAGQA